MTDVAFELVTSTDFSEYFPNFFAGRVDGRYFSAWFIPEEKQIYVTMGISSLTPVSKDNLLARVRASACMSEETLRFEDHSVCGRVPVYDAEWLSRFKSAVTLLGEWAAANQITSGCFLCGRDDLTVLYRNDDDRNAYICDQCLEAPPNLYSQEIEQMKAEARKPVVLENRWRGICLTLLVRAAISVIWIPTMMFALDSKLAILVPLFGSAGITFISYLLYRKFAGIFSNLSKVIVTTLLVGFSFLEYYISAGSIVSEHVNSVFPDVNLNIFEVILNLSHYLSSPGLHGAYIVVNLIVLPLTGLAFVAISYFLIRGIKHFLE